jgi:hypothetical protein
LTQRSLRSRPTDRARRATGPGRAVIPAKFQTGQPSSPRSDRTESRFKIRDYGERGPVGVGSRAVVGARRGCMLVLDPAAGLPERRRPATLKWPWLHQGCNPTATQQGCTGHVAPPHGGTRRPQTQFTMGQNETPGDGSGRPLADCKTAITGWKSGRRRGHRVSEPAQGHARTGCDAPADRTGRAARPTPPTVCSS